MFYFYTLNSLLSNKYDSFPTYLFFTPLVFPRPFSLSLSPISSLPPFLLTPILLYPSFPCPFPSIPPSCYLLHDIKLLDLWWTITEKGCILVLMKTRINSINTITFRQTDILTDIQFYRGFYVLKLI